jgi:hypothetical protein
MYGKPARALELRRREPARLLQHARERVRALRQKAGELTYLRDRFERVAHLCFGMRGGDVAPQALGSFRHAGIHERHHDHARAVEQHRRGGQALELVADQDRRDVRRAIADVDAELAQAAAEERAISLEPFAVCPAHTAV